jgi:hypothetical protein
MSRSDAHATENVAARGKFGLFNSAPEDFASVTPPQSNRNADHHLIEGVSKRAMTALLE